MSDLFQELLLLNIWRLFELFLDEAPSSINYKLVLNGVMAGHMEDDKGNILASWATMSDAPTFIDEARLRMIHGTK